METRVRVYKDPMQDAYSAVSADPNITRWPAAPTTVAPYVQRTPCNARIACMACATRTPRNACVTCSDRKAFLPGKIASTCEYQIAGSDAPHRSVAGGATIHPACRRVDIVRRQFGHLPRCRTGTNVQFRRDHATRRGHYSLVWAGSVLRKWASRAVDRPKYRPPDS